MTEAISAITITIAMIRLIRLASRVTAAISSREVLALLWEVLTCVSIRAPASSTALTVRLAMMSAFSASVLTDFSGGVEEPLMIAPSPSTSSCNFLSFSSCPASA